MACRADACVLIAVLVVLVVMLVGFSFTAAHGERDSGERLTIWPIKWEARDN